MKYKIINLKEDTTYLTDYIDLRNDKSEELLSEKVYFKETLKWFEKENIIIRGLVRDLKLKSVGIIYLDKNNEFSFFCKESSKGYGNTIHNVMISLAKKRGLEFLTAWTRNNIAENIFKKKGWELVGKRERKYKDKKIVGYDYIIKLT